VTVVGVGVVGVVGVDVVVPAWAGF